MKNTIDKLKLKKYHSKIIKAKIITSKNAYDYIRQFYFDDIDIYESVFILLIDASNTTIGYAKISQGGVIGTVIDVKLICKYVIDSLAMGVILAHNHPTGNLKASDSDMQITSKVKDALNIFDCKLLDHIILSSNKYLSMADEGILI
jgi:DNA repair protein RadC